MAIPDYQSLMLPLLAFAADGKEHSVREAREHIAASLGLSDNEREELLPSGRQPVYDNRVAWAKTYLQQAGLLEASRRAYFRITARGYKILNENPISIDSKLLERFPEFVEFRTSGKKSDRLRQKLKRRNVSQPHLRKCLNSLISRFELIWQLIFLSGLRLRLRPFSSAWLSSY